MTLYTSPKLVELVNFVLEKTGIHSHVGAIKYEIEEDIRATNLDEGDDEFSNLYPTYRNTFHEEFIYYSDNSINILLKSISKTTEIELLEKMLINKELKIDIERKDYVGQEWNFEIALPKSINKTDSERIYIQVNADIKAYSNDYKLSASTNVYYKDIELDKILTLYKLQL